MITAASPLPSNLKGKGGLGPTLKGRGTLELMTLDTALFPVKVCRLCEPCELRWDWNTFMTIFIHFSQLTNRENHDHYHLCINAFILYDFKNFKAFINATPKDVHSAKWLLLVM
jgi:hypothetical protein